MFRFLHTMEGEGTVDQVISSLRHIMIGRCGGRLLHRDCQIQGEMLERVGGDVGWFLHTPRVVRTGDQVRSSLMHLSISRQGMLLNKGLSPGAFRHCVIHR